MRIFLLGATGKTGAQLIDLGLARGHSITAFVRSPAKIIRKDAALTVVKGDPLDVDALAAALPRHDVVLSALGMRPPGAFRPHSLVHDGAASVVAAMTRAGVERIVFVSAAVLFPEKGVVFAFFRWFLKHIARDLAAAENIVRATSLAWTIVRPPRLVDATTETYRVAVDALPPDAHAMSFRAVAAFMLDAAEQPIHLRELVGLAP
ncbi:MAG: Flavin reductase [Myxococcaceae bacterium]|jgi:putative NADH-flavin reductase|nr:Flavin reductase [Myxococcaceae bacterium]